MIQGLGQLGIYDRQGPRATRGRVLTGPIGYTRNYRNAAMWGSRSLLVSGSGFKVQGLGRLDVLRTEELTKSEHCFTHRLQSSSFLGLPYRVDMNHEKELLWILWVDKTHLSN